MIFGVALCLLGAVFAPVYRCEDEALEHTSGLELEDDVFTMTDPRESELAELWEYVDLEAETLKRAA